MSYILDALRRADAERERERGAVPSLHAQPSSAAATPRPGWAPVALGLAAVATVAVVAALVWAWPERVQPPAASVPRVPAAVASASAPVLSPPPAPAPATAPAPVPVPVWPDPPRVVVAAPVPATTPTQTPPPAAAASTSPPAVAARPAQPPVTALSELSPELRRSLPAMAIGGAIYSDSPAGRFFIVNGQVVREGETAAPGVTVERIGPKSATVRWKEMRLEVPF